MHKYMYDMVEAIFTLFKENYIMKGLGQFY